MKDFMRSFARNPGALVGLGFLLLVVLVAIFAGVLFPVSPWQMVGTPFMPPGHGGFLLGSDSLGRNVAIGIVYGARVSLLIGVVSTLVSLAIGIGLGALAGYAGGLIDDAIMGLTEFFQTIPSFILAVVLVAIFSPTLFSIVGSIALVSWQPVARVVRAEFRTFRGREFVQAAEVLGRSRTSIIFHEILPNALPPVIVLGSLMIASSILLESALSFLGLGDPNLMSWGFMIGAGRSVIQLAWWVSVFPGVAIFLTVLALNLVGEGLGDALDPRLMRRRQA